MAFSSINFQKSTSYALAHNFRIESNKEAKYLLPKEVRLENAYWNLSKNGKELFEEELNKREKTKSGKKPELENSLWEAVLNLNAHHEIQDVKKVATHIENKFNITCYAIALHKDEGYIDKQTKEVKFNYHAHLNFMTYKDQKQNWKQALIRPKLSELQTEIADILQMERGKLNSTTKRLEHKEYKQQIQKQEALKEELTKEIKLDKQIIDIEYQAIKVQYESIHREKEKLQQEQQELLKNTNTLTKTRQKSILKAKEYQSKEKNLKARESALKKEYETFEKEKQNHYNQIEQKVKEILEQQKQFQEEILKFSHTSDEIIKEKRNAAYEQKSGFTNNLRNIISFGSLFQSIDDNLQKEEELIRQAVVENTKRYKTQIQEKENKLQKAYQLLRERDIELIKEKNKRKALSNMLEDQSSYLEFS